MTHEHTETFDVADTHYSAAVHWTGDKPAIVDFVLRGTYRISDGRGATVTVCSIIAHGTVKFDGCVSISFRRDTTPSVHTCDGYAGLLDLHRAFAQVYWRASQQMKHCGYEDDVPMELRR